MSREELELVDVEKQMEEQLVEQHKQARVPLAASPAPGRHLVPDATEPVLKAAQCLPLLPCQQLLCRQRKPAHAGA